MCLTRNTEAALADTAGQQPHAAGDAPARGTRAARRPGPAGAPRATRAGPAEAGRAGRADSSPACHGGGTGRPDAAGTGPGERSRGGRGVERMGAALPPARLPPADRDASALLPAGSAGALARLPAVRLRGAQHGLPGRVDRLAGPGAPLVRHSRSLPRQHLRRPRPGSRLRPAAASRRQQHPHCNQ